MICELQPLRHGTNTLPPQRIAVAIPPPVSALAQISKAELVALTVIVAAVGGGFLHAVVRDGWESGSLSLILLIALFTLLVLPTGAGVLTRRKGMDRWQNHHDQRTCPWCNNVVGTHRFPGR